MKLSKDEYLDGVHRRALDACDNAMVLSLHVSSENAQNFSDNVKGLWVIISFNSLLKIVNRLNVYLMSVS